MAVGDPDTGLGLTLTHAAATWTAKVIDLTIGARTMTAVDSSDTGVTSGWRTFIAGAKDAGEITFSTVYEKNAEPPMAGLVEAWTVTFPNTGTTAATFACDGFITSITDTVPLDDLISSDVTIKLSGAPTFTAEA